MPNIMLLVTRLSVVSDNPRQNYFDAQLWYMFWKMFISIFFNGSYSALRDERMFSKKVVGMSYKYNIRRFIYVFFYLWLLWLLFYIYFLQIFKNRYIYLFLWNLFLFLWNLFLLLILKIMIIQQVLLRSL